MANKIILNITPRTWVRVTFNDRIFFRIPRHLLRPSGLKRLERIEKYNDYKVSLLALAKEKQFSIPAQGCGITFFIPCPKSWSQKKKRQYHGTIHQSKPDLKNCLQAFEDGLCIEDKYIAHYSSICKRWVDFPTGWIEVTESEPTLPAVVIPPTEG
jgi:Holliday junction resolvase RusA-like endonuclease